MQWVIFMDELNLLAQRVWKRVAQGEAYVPEKPKRKQQKQEMPLFLLLLVIVILKAQVAVPVCVSEGV